MLGASVTRRRAQCRRVAIAIDRWLQNQKPAHRHSCMCPKNENVGAGSGKGGTGVGSGVGSGLGSSGSVSDTGLGKTSGPPVVGINSCDMSPLPGYPCVHRSEAILTAATTVSIKIMTITIPLLSRTSSLTKSAFIRSSRRIPASLVARRTAKR